MRALLTHPTIPAILSVFLCRGGVGSGLGVGVTPDAWRYPLGRGLRGAATPGTTAAPTKHPTGKTALLLHTPPPRSPNRRRLRHLRHRLPARHGNHAAPRSCCPPHPTHRPNRKTSTQRGHQTTTNHPHHRQRRPPVHRTTLSGSGARALWVVDGGFTLANQS